ncbi:CTP synthase [Candidatus Woesebacteria bacterium RIFOXYD1_FULL_41_28]|uniref:CTP synthase n=1 Tax=Candidatus Woesebacteria bacterium RIFOXYD1_FULL_41_28 TaxID=1802550 RepID=A0A1F8DIP6_9BACT|nr:MAG: CTP synthase [Candidatus Woesebacteria bacterium RIFOXYD1_FULL_41_28]
MSSSKVKYILVSGGVLSGLGKGITAASLGLLLQSRGYKVTIMKCDMYLNIDAGTMNPLEHGEVFVTQDGLETDQDLGHYERFLGISLSRANYLTNGQIYQYVLDKERALDYGGKCVEPYHHIPPEILSRWQEAGVANKADIVLVELGGTVGEYEGLLFFEAYRRLKLQVPKDVALVHVGYLPAPGNIGELKSKPVQQSISTLNSLGIMPDFVVGRAEKPIDDKRKEKIALASGLPIENIISNPDLDSVYKVPLMLKKEKLDLKVLKKLGLKSNKLNLEKWEEMVKKIDAKKDKVVKIGIVGKYQRSGDYILQDSYVSVVEALRHASVASGIGIELDWIDSEDKKMNLTVVDAILVPQGWGRRGIEGKVKAVKFARENNIPYLGLCFGMQMATIEFARHVLGYQDANTEEADEGTKHPVIHVMDYQKDLIKSKRFGGTIRLGAWPLKIKKGTLLEKIYRKNLVLNERHRHRYEFNNKFKEAFEKKGFVISGTSPDGKLVEAIELKNHKFFVGTQYHPEYISRALFPHPIFIEFLKAAADK